MSSSTEHIGKHAHVTETNSGYNLPYVYLEYSMSQARHLVVRNISLVHSHNNRIRNPARASYSGLHRWNLPAATTYQRLVPIPVAGTLLALALRMFGLPVLLVFVPREQEQRGGPVAGPRSHMRGPDGAVAGVETVPDSLVGRSST